MSTFQCRIRATYLLGILEHEAPRTSTVAFASEFIIVEFFILQEPLFVRFISYLALKSFTFFTVDQPLVRLSSPTTILSFSFAIYPTTTC